MTQRENLCDNPRFAEGGSQGSVVCAGIHMSDIPRCRYRLVWEERSLVSVANQTRVEFLRLAPRVGIVTSVTEYPLRQANEGLADLWAGRFEEAGVLVP
jgi:alcohol dehydrogenase, propanol-preferring